ncbi:MAG: hypothetical protein L0Z07_07170 [Planctomycetes bacterium]|nr:hypothetical protein [Planctomycetota bacterium]
MRLLQRSAVNKTAAVAFCQRAIWMHRWRGVGLAVSLGLAMLAASLAHAATSTDATSNRVAREEAVRAIPWQEMVPLDRRNAHFVVKNAAIYRRLPTRVIDCDPDMFVFLAQHPEVIIDVWHVMGVSQVKLDRMPDGAFRGTDGAGTTGTVRYLYSNWGEGTQNLAVVFAEGAYEGQPFVQPIQAQTLVLLRYDTVQETNGRHYITVRVDSFVHIEQIGIELVAKTVQPWITKTADRNLIETLSFVSNFSRTAEKNPQGMRRLATRLTAVDEPTRDLLVQLCFRTAERHARLEQTHRTSGALLVQHGKTTANASK